MTVVPKKYNGAQFPIRNGEVGSSGGICFSLMGAVSVGQSIRSHSQCLSSECTDYIPVSQPLTCFSTEGPIPLALHSERMLRSERVYSLPDIA